MLPTAHVTQAGHLKEESKTDKKVYYPGAENRLTKPSKYDPKPGEPEGKILAFDGTAPWSHNGLVQLQTHHPTKA
jgi:hypothetical protein